MKEIQNYMYYIFNRWSADEACLVFGNELGTHIFCKWLQMRDGLRLFGYFDKECKKKLVNRVNEIYDK